MTSGDGIVREAEMRNMLSLTGKARRAGSEWLIKGLDDMLSAIIMSTVIFKAHTAKVAAKSLDLQGAENLKEPCCFQVPESHETP